MKNSDPEHLFWLYDNPLRPIWRKSSSLESGISCLREYYPGIFPHQVETYFDPFLGEGSMYFNVCCKDKRVNDYSLELIEFYELVKNRDKEFLRIIGGLADLWSILGDMANEESLQLYLKGNDVGLGNVVNARKRELYDSLFCIKGNTFFLLDLKTNLVAWARKLRRLEFFNDIENDERILYLRAAFRAGLYAHVRMIYNMLKGSMEPLKIACYYFLRRYAYRGIFRQNQHKHLTTAFAGTPMNSLPPDGDVDYWYHTTLEYHLKMTTFESADCLDFLKNEEIKVNDFVFLNPPQSFRTKAYSEYKFDYEDHKRLARWLVNYCTGQWMMILKPNRAIEDLYLQARRRGVHFTYFTQGFRTKSNFRDEYVRHIVVKNY